MTLLGMVFPGQGSQEVGMLAELAQDHTIVEETFAEASSVLGYNLWQRVQKGPSKELNKTSQTQPALLAASVAIWRVWQEHGGKMPMLLAGHSLGEYSALVCAGTLDFTAAIELVTLRGKLMEEAVPTGIGAMSAIIGLESDAVAAACEQAAQGQVVSPANFNAPGQVVITGHKEAVQRASLTCKALGAKRVILLPISVPSHSGLMRFAAEKLFQAMEAVKFTPPKIPVINNVHVRPEQDPEEIRQALVRQLYSPVRWTETVEYLADQGVEALLEMGPSNVLTGLTKRIVGSLSAAVVNDPASLSTALKYYN
ncbi:ACP S-malonyltransferase [Candidatus Steffania adelgidicola]|uniref:ACP S-malonyltransferase n=1 Tax=Candidatus Steffania adelgidicola TaxID=1076626 RepID=UPI001D02148B|nr:ACP S-malonyltransferase [Candidatus Steffania adelgidicola]UDG79990.1 Malonyl CoA-acyl carrier protein transacylase [Candidatus Steffania adelgidicola]